MDILKDISIAIGKRVKAIRKAQGMTQEQLGLLTNIDSADISKYESGKINLTLKTFSKFAPPSQPTSIDGRMLRISRTFSSCIRLAVPP